MQQTRVIALSGSDTVVQAIRKHLPEAFVERIDCLENIPDVEWRATLIVDPGAVQPCCLRWLGDRRRRKVLGKVIYLCLPAPRAILFSLPQACPGRVVELKDLGTILRRHRPHLTRLAWQQMAGILSAPAWDARQRRFLALARARRRGRLSSGEVAKALRIGVRQLDRLSRDWFGHPPHVVLGLFRVERLARDLRRGANGLAELVREHGYVSRQSLNRQFQAYTGLTPAAFRIQDPARRSTILRAPRLPVAKTASRAYL
jgi:AraC-like DNA-binding protein